MRADRVRLIFVVLVITGALLALFWPQAGRSADTFFGSIFKNIRLGLDIKGGSRIDYAIVPAADSEKSIDELANEVVTVVRQRLDSANFTEAVVARVGSGTGTRIRVEIPGIDDPTVAERLVGKRGKLYFAEVLESQKSPTKPAKKIGISYKDAYWLEGKEKVDGESMWYLVNPYVTVNNAKTYLDGSSVSDARASADTQRGGFRILLSFDRQGADIFGRVTTAKVGEQLPIVLDELVLVAPVVQNAIRDGSAEISGQFTAQEAMELAALIKSGNLPAELEKLEERTLGPSLGKDIVTASLIAGLFGLAIVLVYMVVVYGTFGIVADIALLYNTLLLLGIMSAGRFILTLPGIGGIILTIGTTVDGNIIVFERIKEEMRLGKTVLNSITGGYAKSFSTIFDANITTILAGVVLYYLGTGTIKGFATTLIIGILGSMFTTLVVSRVLLDGFSGTLKNKWKPSTAGTGGEQK
ncbi:MAG TPA: protein translocase subunit SecD [Thermotogota bacterium]|nr:protein translocase subunit SecD [Thermotogota bacterium]HRW91609.1 protein translocase subunit SecD [Thermotogota bacterium]